MIESSNCTYYIMYSIIIQTCMHSSLGQWARAPILFVLQVCFVLVFFISFSFRIDDFKIIENSSTPVTMINKSKVLFISAISHQKGNTQYEQL